MKKYNDSYYLVRRLKPFLQVSANDKTIYVPEGKELEPKAQKYVDILLTNFGFVIQSTIEVCNYELIYLSSSLGLSGHKIHFLQHKLFGLVPGQKVSKIGKGNETGSNHLDKFSKPYEYAGALLINSIKYYAFELPEAVQPVQNKKFYMLYQKDKYFLYRTIFNKDNSVRYVRTFKPIFKIIN